MMKRDQIFFNILNVNVRNHCQRLRSLRENILNIAGDRRNILMENLFNINLQIIERAVPFYRR